MENEDHKYITLTNKSLILGLYGAILFSLNLVRWDHMSSGRFPEVKTIGKFKMSAQKGGCLREVRARLREVVAYERFQT